MSAPASRITIIRRNFGHWDFYDSACSGRAFRLRGTPGEWLAMDERQEPYPTTQFRSFPTCLAFIMEQFMHEDLMTDQNSPGNNMPQSARQSGPTPTEKP